MTYPRAEQTAKSIVTLHEASQLARQRGQHHAANSLDAILLELVPTGNGEPSHDELVEQSGVIKVLIAN
jgi:hypothetical protein